MVIRVYTDGGARGNPGHSAIGILFVKDDAIIWSNSKYLGKGTNNNAEYKALITALEHAKSEGYSEIEIYSDSELMIKQMRGEYKVKAAALKPLHLKAKSLEKEFEKISYHNVRRSDKYITEADRILNETLDSREGR